MLTAPVEYNITIRKGNDFEQLYEFQDDTGAAMDLTGYTVKSQIKASKSLSATAVATFTVSTPDATGYIYLRLTDAQTGALTIKTGYYDILLTSATGVDDTYVTGVCTIEETVTIKG
jgi:hypothetical protein